ncbi:MAG: flagellar hook-basal body complex protein FliE [Vampirovibrionia bacterium]
MSNSFIPKVDGFKMMENPKIDTAMSSPFRMNAVKPEQDVSSFSSVMTDLISNLDTQAKKPEKMVAEAMVNPNVDLHDVAIAINQSELTLTIATQATTKIIQGYEKIISMQV